MPDSSTDNQVSPDETQQPPAVVAAPRDETATSEEVRPLDDTQAPATIMRWVDAKRGTRGRYTIGVDFDGHQLAIVEIRKLGKQHAISRLWVAKWTETPTVEMLSDHLREFTPREHPTVELVISSARGMVRRFLIPRVPARRRIAAALWKGGQLFPFLLNGEESLFGTGFTSDGKSGWQTTLVALPRDDASSICQAIEHLGWELSKVSLIGTQYPPGAKPVGRESDVPVEAVVWCSPRRALFSIFRNHRLIFQYDLGTLPGFPRSPSDKVVPARDDPMGSWTTALHSGVVDALDLHLSADPNHVPSHLRVVGVSEATAPMVAYLTELGERFDGGVAVVDPVREFNHDLPDEIAGWVSANTGMLAPAVLAASGAPSVDLTPASIRKRQKERQLLKYARTALVLSVAVVVAWTALMWKHTRSLEPVVQSYRQDYELLQNSPTTAKITSSLGVLARHRRLLTQLQQPPVGWMPWIRTVFGTVPTNGSLTAMSVDAGPSHPNQPDASLTVRLHGTLSPDGPPHAVNYRRWIGRLEMLAGPGRAELVDERTVNWKGRRRSNFLLELRPLVQTIRGGEK